MKTTVGRTALEIVSGDITDMVIDAIVSTSNTELWMGAGVAGAIRRTGGGAIEREAMSKGPIQVGEAVVTDGHSLPSKWVIHAAVLEQGLQTSEQAIAAATYATLECADQVKARSVALPAVGAGEGGFPLYECTRVMLSAVVRYLTDHPTTKLRLVVFCAYTSPERAAFTHALTGIERP